MPLRDPNRQRCIESVLSASSAIVRNTVHLTRAGTVARLAYKTQRGVRESIYGYTTDSDRTFALGSA
jgi:hypothetical protein